MASTKYGYHSYIVRQYDDIASDFPAEGVAISDVAIIVAAGDCSVEVTLSSKADINDGNAVWVEYENITGGGVVIFDPAPNGIRLSGTGAAWIKS